MKEEKKEKIAMFRFGVIAGIIGLKESETIKREALIREITDKEWDIPFSGRSYIGRTTVRDWLKRYEESGRRLKSLYPSPRSDAGKSRKIDDETEASLVSLKREVKASTPIILKIARERNLLPPDFDASNQTIYRIFQKHGIEKEEVIREDRRRFEAELPNDMWQSDALHGPRVIVDGKERKSFCFILLDDHSRLIPHGEFYLHENVESFSDCLRKGLLKRGVPGKLYVDNGPCYRAHQLSYACAALGISLIHCKAYRPEGKGKIERFNGTVRGSFLKTIPDRISLSDLNEKFLSWIEKEYHLKEHSGTGEKPIQRYLKGARLVKEAPKDINDYFRTRAVRRVDRDRTVTLEGRIYEAPVDLMEREVTLLYHKDDPTRVEVCHNDKSFGFLVPSDKHINYRIKRGRSGMEIKQDSEKPEDPEREYKGGELFSRREKDE